MSAVCKLSVAAVLLITTATLGLGQKRKHIVKKPPVKPAATAEPTASPVPAPIPEPKKNERPSTVAPPIKESKFTPEYVYEFKRPGFGVDFVHIEHDEAGKGSITFRKENIGEDITDPVELSAVTMERLRGAFEALDFLNSSANYQTPRDYSHLGNISLTLTKSGRSRTAIFNWTENKDAMFLLDEYRRIGSEYIWRFEIDSSRENQPLLAPGLMTSFESLVKRGEVSDPPHIIPFLRELAADERIPLMARNRAADIIKYIEKDRKK